MKAFIRIIALALTLLMLVPAIVACGEKADAANHIYKDSYCTVCKHYNPNYRSDNPNTGDSFSPALHIALCLMSVFGFAWVSQVAKKKGMF